MKNENKEKKGNKENKKKSEKEDKRNENNIKNSNTDSLLIEIKDRKNKKAIEMEIGIQIERKRAREVVMKNLEKTNMNYDILKINNINIIQTSKFCCYSSLILD